MILDEFYKLAIASVGYSLDEDNFLVKKTSNGTTREHYNKKQIMLYNSSTRLTSSDDIIIFNPLEEDSIKGINPSMVKYKALLEKQLSVSFNNTAELLAMLASDLELQKKASLELNRFISDLNKLRQPNMKEIVDEKFVKLLRNINDTSYTKSINNGSMYIKTEKGKVIDGEKFNKIGMLSLPIYEDLKENPKDIYDIEIKRNKDANIYYSIVEFIVGKNEDNELDIDKYTVGSNSMHSPTFVIIYKLYFKLAKRLNSLLKSLTFIDEDKVKSSLITLALTIEDLAEIDNLVGELKMIPNLSNQRQTSSVSREPVGALTAAPQRYVSPSGRPGLVLPSDIEDNIVPNRPLSAAERLRKANGLPISNNVPSYPRETIREEQYSRQPLHSRVAPGLRPASSDRVAPGLRRAAPVDRPRLELPGDDRRTYSPFRRENFNY